MTGATDAPRCATWLGQREPCLDAPVILDCGGVALGRYGGSRAAGATKNEDGALIWVDPGGGWEVALVLDAHATAESAALVLDTVAAQGDAVAALLADPVATALPAVSRYFAALFASESFRAACRGVVGETACLLAVRRANFLWWLSVGDCVAYLLHPDLARRGQYALNQRQFFEWIGQVNTFDLPVPCYTTGMRELRGGRNVLLLVTDGLLEFADRPFERPGALYDAFFPPDSATAPIASAVESLLRRVHASGGRDSATIVAWHYENPLPGTLPTQ